MSGTVWDGLCSLVNWIFGKSIKRHNGSIDAVFKRKYNSFLQILESNAELLRIIAEIEDARIYSKKLGHGKYRVWSSRTIFHVLRMVRNFESLAGRSEQELHHRISKIQSELERIISSLNANENGPWILDLDSLQEDHAILVGGKANALGVLARGGFPVPHGFVVTTAACLATLCHGAAWEEIQHILLRMDPTQESSVYQVSAELTALVQSLPLPEVLERAMLDAMDALARRCGQDPQQFRVAVRSSAEGEDGASSFAGQYQTVLGVDREGLGDAYRQVLVSLFRPEALVYRSALGMDMGAMAVLVQEMIPAQAAGVLFTRDPRCRENDSLVLDAAWGLGVVVVDGLLVPDRWVLQRRDEGVAIVERIPGEKPIQVVLGEGGVREDALSEERQKALCLDDAQVLRLGDLGMALERYLGGPQDVEWVLRPDKSIVIVQSRPLTCAIAPPALHPEVGIPPLLQGGEAAYAGVGAGPVVVVRSPQDLEDFPQGAVLVASHSSPAYLVVLPKAAAVVTEFGSATGHMASLCREFCVPSLLGIPRALEVLLPGYEVTVDALGRRVYPGRVEALLAAERLQCQTSPQTVPATVDALHKLIVPLHLVDPKAPEFAPAGCRTVHDIMRYIHECSYAEMFHLSDLVADHQGASLRLDAPTGLDLHVIDLGGALVAGAGRQGWIRPEDVVSRPFAALLQGLVLGEAALRHPRPVHVRGLLSVLQEQALASPQLGRERFGDKSYAIVSDKYLNFSSRVGYHYGVLDCYCGNTINKNYISFVFKGGAADDVKRSRRAQAIAAILSRLNFRVETVADQSFARFHKAEASIIENRLIHVGRLLQFTRQTDMLMVNDACVDAMVESFFRGDAFFEGPC